MREPSILPPLCLVCGERGQIYGTGFEDRPFTCGKCDAWGMSEDNVDTPYEDDDGDWRQGQVRRPPPD